MAMLNNQRVFGIDYLVFPHNTNYDPLCTYHEIPKIERPLCTYHDLFWLSPGLSTRCLGSTAISSWDDPKVVRNPSVPGLIPEKSTKQNGQNSYQNMSTGHLIRAFSSMMGLIHLNPLFLDTTSVRYGSKSSTTGLFCEKTHHVTPSGFLTHFKHIEKHADTAFFFG